MSTERELLEARIRELEGRLAQADRLACIGQMSASIAHEINNPVAYVLANLTALTDLLDELEASGESEGARQALKGAREILVDCSFGMERIQRIARDLKVFARVEDQSPERIDVNRVVEAACQLAANEVRHRARLVMTLGKLPSLLGDQGKLTQVVLNLLINAAQAIESGDASKHRVSVETSCADEVVSITVSDTGKGIEDRLITQIFEPFFTTKFNHGGTGLGLWLVQDIVRIHGGEVRVQSVPGRGASFEVRLPANRVGVHSARPPEASESPKESLPARRRAQLLLIDDDAALRRALRRMLSLYHDVVEADGGMAGIDMLDSGQRFDAVLCDLMMPDVDGPAVYEHIAHTRPELLDRLAFLSGGVFTQRARSFLEEVEHQVVEKPVSREALLRVIDGLLSADIDDPAQVLGGSK